MSPGEFIPLFEKNGFIYQLDQYVWEHVCALLHQWKEAGLALLPVSVNVSRSDVCHTHLVNVLRGLIEKYDVDPKYLHLEITESAYAENPGQIVSTVSQLRSLGFPIEMDDFGSGYNSDKNLVELKPKYVKLDIAMVRDVNHHADRQLLISGLITFAHEQNMLVLAEGVETLEELDCLLRLGVDLLQGFLLARPAAVPGSIDPEALALIQSFAAAADQDHPVSAPYTFA